MLTQTNPSPVEKFQEKLPETYVADEQEEILLEPGDLVISTTAGWDEVLEALVKHANEHMNDGEWTAQMVVDELKEWA